MKLARSIVVATALVAAGSCARLPLAEPKLEGPYGLELGRDTQRASIYEGVETRLFIHVVWLKPELLAAQAAKVSEMRAETPAMAAARLAQLQAENDAGPAFFAIAYTPTPSWNDFEAKDSVWRIALEDGPGGPVAPTRVTRYDAPFNAELAALYPYLDEFVTAYRIQFPKGSLGAVPNFLFAGALGKTELAWPPPP